MIQKLSPFNGIRHEKLLSVEYNKKKKKKNCLLNALHYNIIIVVVTYI